MRIFRELHKSDDDPFRRQKREDPSPTKDEGDLFIHRPSPRKIRVLLDVEHLPEDTSSSVQLFEALLRHSRVFSLAVEASTITSTDYSTPAQRGRIHVCDTTAVAGDFSYPGPQYGWSINDKDAHPDGSSTLSVHGATHPQRQIYETVQSYRHLGQQYRTDFRLKDAVTQTVLAEVAREAGFDLLVSEDPAAVCQLLPVHNRVVVISRAEAVPVLAHYLRRQHVFLADPRFNASYTRHDFFHQSVHTLAPALRGWEARVGWGMSEVAADVQSRYLTAVSRLARALESRDDIIWSLGSNLTSPVLEDCMDDFDHLLLLLCGGVDVFARALHLALGLPQEEVRDAKLHASWYVTNVRDRYSVNPAETVELAELNRLQNQLRVIFELRNSIHNVQIRPVLAISLFSGSGRSRGEAPFLAHVTADIAERIKKIDTGSTTEWGFRESYGGGAIADLWVIADKAVETTFRFLDLLSLIVLRNPLPESAAAILSGEAPTMPSRETPWENYDDHLPALLGLPVPQRVAADRRGPFRRSGADDEVCSVGNLPAEGIAHEDGQIFDQVISVQETWWRAHIRACIVTLYKRNLTTVPPNVEDVSGWVPEEWIRDALASARCSSGSEWPDAMGIARAVLVDRYGEDFPADWSFVVLEGEGSQTYSRRVSAPDEQTTSA